jgi:type VI secretion system protein ImpH
MRDPIALEARFASDIGRFSFFQALRLLECTYAGLPRIGRAVSPADEPVRLGQDPDFAFVASEVGDYRRGTADMPPRIAVRFLGLLGSNGPMPLYLTEYVRDRAVQSGDRTVVGFLDMFHHRMLSLFYRAWAINQPVVSHDRPGDEGFAWYVGSLCGLAFRDARPRIPNGRRHGELEFAGLFAARTRSADGLSRLLTQVARAPVRVVQFVGQWLLLPIADRTRLHRNSNRPLGYGLTLGGRVWDRQHKIRLVIGPLDAAGYRRLQPGGCSIATLGEWLRLYVGPTLDCEVELRIRSDACSPTRFGGGSRLSRTTWLGEPHPVRGEVAALWPEYVRNSIHD